MNMKTVVVAIYAQNRCHAGRVLAVPESTASLRRAQPIRRTKWAIGVIVLHDMSLYLYSAIDSTPGSVAFTTFIEGQSRHDNTEALLIEGTRGFNARAAAQGSPLARTNICATEMNIARSSIPSRAFTVPLCGASCEPLSFSGAITGTRYE